jgi:hypothetical protein
MSENIKLHRTYMKSFELVDGIAQTRTYVPEEGKRVICQNLDDALDRKQLLPNTRHAQLPQRLSVSAISSHYPGAYRPQGIIFTTAEDPAYCIPFDLLALTDSRDFTSEEYQKKFLPHSEQFIFKTVEAMLATYPSAEDALRALNTFRKTHPLEPIAHTTRSYNECCFEQPIRILPLAIIGNDPLMQKIANNHHLPLYASVAEYLRNEVNK